MNDLTEEDIQRANAEADDFWFDSGLNALMHTPPSVEGCGKVHVWADHVTPTPWAYKCAVAHHLKTEHPPERLMCACGEAATIVVTIEVIGQPNLTSHKPKCKETCSGQEDRS